MYLLKRCCHSNSFCAFISGNIWSLFIWDVLSPATMRVVQWTLLFKNSLISLSLFPFITPPPTPAPHPQSVITNILYYVSLRGIMGQLIVSVFLLEQDTEQSVFWLWWRMLESFAWAPRKATNAHPSLLPSIILSLYSHLSALWPPAINNKTLLSNAESSQAV